MSVGLIVLSFVAAAAGTLGLGFVLRGVDRKVTARVQYRVGPPIIQPAIDVLKLMAKENIMPATARGTLFLLAPVIALAATAVAATILWRALLWPGEAPFVGDLIVVIYLLVIPALMLVMGASASGNPHASVGAARELKLLLSYELPMFLVLLVPVAQAGWTFQLGAIQQATPALYGVSGVIAFVGLVVPHLLRLLIGPDHRALIPASALGGAVLLVVADLLARIVVPSVELPVGIMTSLLGCPFFLYLLHRRRYAFP